MAPTYFDIVSAIVADGSILNYCLPKPLMDKLTILVDHFYFLLFNT